MLFNLKESEFRALCALVEEDTEGFEFMRQVYEYVAQIKGPTDPYGQVKLSKEKWFSFGRKTFAGSDLEFCSFCVESVLSNHTVSERLAKHFVYSMQKQQAEKKQRLKKTLLCGAGLSALALLTYYFGVGFATTSYNIANRVKEVTNCSSPFMLVKDTPKTGKELQKESYGKVFEGARQGLNGKYGNMLRDLLEAHKLDVEAAKKYREERKAAGQRIGRQRNGTFLTPSGKVYGKPKE